MSDEDHEAGSPRHPAPGLDPAPGLPPIRESGKAPHHCVPASRWSTRQKAQLLVPLSTMTVLKRRSEKS